MNARSRTTQLCIGVLVLALVSACASLVDRIPPQALTDTAMTETFVRIEMFMKEHGKTPPNLAVLPTREGYANRTTDAWGRELQYTVDDTGIITLRSLGADGKPGGDGLNKDNVRRYRTRNPDGSSCIHDEYWIVNAEIE